MKADEDGGKEEEKEKRDEKDMTENKTICQQN